MKQRELQPAGSARSLGASLLVIVLAGAAVLGGALLIVATVRASLYQGQGESYVYELLVWGFPLSGISLATLLGLVVGRAIRRRIRTHRAETEFAI